MKAFRLVAAVALAIFVMVGAAQPAAAKSSHHARMSAVRFALAQKGDPYVYGAAGPRAFDCSGLIYAAFRHRVPRTSYALYNGGYRPRKLRVGDLVFRGPGHVGMYIGHGKVIHAPHTGDVVRIAPLSVFDGKRTARRWGRF
jgi:cell wall-associated NlpC family hydrolase